MRLVLFGKNGQVGWELQRSLAPLGELIDLSAQSADYCGDLADPIGISATIARLKPDVVVNAAAYTAVDKAESEADRARLINADAPAAMAAAAKACGALLVHYSTDYVFNGSGQQPWCEQDATDPLSVYGATKLAGEAAIRSSGCDYLILRTSWVYAARGSNFASTMVRLAGQRDRLGIVADQIGAPTSAELIADVSAHAIVACLADAEKQGVYHLTAAGSTSWADYARLVFDVMAALRSDFKIPVIEPIASNAYPTPARRPRNSRLDCSLLATTFHLTLPAWQQGVQRMLTERYGNQK
ncbi:dTDP-4-dehydrorhamnose reductase [Herbaspirillum rubrisubalbicans]|uniref:dTDP-4-dehydrorhamnose reductase n=1 Tax=Herbaspirillum rubrisubalbicans TaxID=80842 RepID=A0ABX9BV40_9BURK|nr:dTDP-4-dehydrorhamnose reductase [Herbaspirillum rubrisubalbicans]RAM61651.1 dTDP-4-dehydrorhamnose reductase [Herbaspirillum rubrisubalbicans]RAN44035.1 dTDP-4-dehydrorhamnose reductase [Herbaspirillum rubrisubalbicans]